MYPERYRSYSTVRRAKKRGDIIQQNCQHCNSEKSKATFKDYSKPLEVVWLCVRCRKQNLYQWEGNNNMAILKKIKAFMLVLVECVEEVSVAPIKRAYFRAKQWI